MPTLTANDYYTRGVQAGLNCPDDQKPVMPLKPGTWQARAWERGCEAGLRDRDQRGARHAEHEERAELIRHFHELHATNMLAGWRGAAREHFLRLLADYTQERSPKRQARLYAALVRMHIRHSFSH